MYWVFCIFMHMHVFCACLVSAEPEEDVKCLRTGITDACKLFCGVWESKPGPLQEQQVLYTADPSLQPFKFVFT